MFGLCRLGLLFQYCEIRHTISTKQDTLPNGEYRCAYSLGTARDSDYESADSESDVEFFPTSQETFARAELAQLLRQLHAAREALHAHEERLALDSAATGKAWDVLATPALWLVPMRRRASVLGDTIMHACGP